MIYSMVRVATALVLALLPVTSRAAAEIQEVTSPGGIRAWLVEEPSIPFTAIEIQIRGGAGVDRPGKRGAVNMMASLMGEGAGERDAIAFQEAREGLAANFSFGATDDALTVSATILTKNRPEAVALLRDALTAPRFDADAVERVRAQVLAGIAWDAEDPESIAVQTASAVAFPDHPYGAPVYGSAGTVAALTRGDLVQAHRDALVRGRVYVGVVGDITAVELGPLLDELLRALPDEGPPLPPDVEPVLTGGITLVDYPTPQSVAVFGQGGLARDDPDFFAAYVLNHILGGGDARSRLWLELRERRGLTYGIGTMLEPRDHADLWLGYVASANGTIAEVVGLIRDAWTRLAGEGVTDAELTAAKTYLTGEYQLRFAGNSHIAAILAEMQMDDLPPSFVADYSSQIEAVTMDDVRRVAAERLNSASLSFVVVGQPEGLGADVTPPADTSAPNP
jgi:zinc protease